MSKLLISVRSLTETRIALEGGADLIDVKEPRAGPLGYASAQVVQRIVRFVAGRLPVSAALGELLENALLPGPGPDFVKWGLAGCGETSDWTEQLSARGRRLHRVEPCCKPVAVAYADRELARSPRLEEIVAFACSQRWPVILVDTWSKHQTLLDWMTPEKVRAFCRSCHDAGLRIALAGSLDMEAIKSLRDAAPDWFAVRGAVCTQGRRTATIEADRVFRLAEFIADRPITANLGNR
jgi:uncharacterized protein (UPF0264 family)